MKCPGGCDFDLPDDILTRCVPCARRVENVCEHAGCTREVWIQNAVPMVDRPIHRFCFEHRNEGLHGATATQ